MKGILLFLTFLMFISVKGASEASILEIPEFLPSENYVHDLHHWMAGYYNVFFPPKYGIESCGHVTVCFNQKESYYFLNYLDAMAKWFGCIIKKKSNFVECINETKKLTALASFVKNKAVCWSKVVQMKGIYPNPSIIFQDSSNPPDTTQVMNYIETSIDLMTKAFSLAGNNHEDIDEYQASGRNLGLAMQSYFPKK